MALHKADIMSVVWPTPNMDNNSKKGVLRVCIFYCVAQLQLKGEDDPVRQLLVASELFNIFKPL